MALRRYENHKTNHIILFHYAAALAAAQVNFSWFWSDVKPSKSVRLEKKAFIKL